MTTTHDDCPGSWCTTLVCEQCGEMLTNPRPVGDAEPSPGALIKGICPVHGRNSKAVLMRREDCLLQPGLPNN